MDRYSVLKYTIITGVGGQTVPLNGMSKYMDFYLYCDSDNDVYKMVCYDYAVKYNYIKGQEQLGHKPIDLDIHRIYFKIYNDDGVGKVHFMTIVNEITSWKRELKWNINMQDKVHQMGCKHKITTEYKIMNIV